MRSTVPKAAAVALAEDPDRTETAPNTASVTRTVSSATRKTLRTATRGERHNRAGAHANESEPQQTERHEYRKSGLAHEDPLSSRRIRVVPVFCGMVGMRGRTGTNSV